MITSNWTSERVISRRIFDTWASSFSFGYFSVLIQISRSLRCIFVPCAQLPYNPIPVMNGFLICDSFILLMLRMILIACVKGVFVGWYPLFFERISL